MTVGEMMTRMSSLEFTMWRVQTQIENSERSHQREHAPKRAAMLPRRRRRR